MLVALRLLAAVAAMKRKREYTREGRKTRSQIKKFDAMKDSHPLEQDHRKNRLARRVKKTIACAARGLTLSLRLLECANPYAILGLTSNVLLRM